MGFPIWTWPEYKEAKLPQRVQLVLIAKDGSGKVVGYGMQGTAIKRVRQGGAPAIRVRWDSGVEGIVVSAARSLRPIDSGEV